MKILQINKYFEPDKGGIESVSKMIDLHLDQSKFKITNLCFGKENKVYEEKPKIKRFSSKKIFSQPLSIRYLFYIFRNLNKFDYVILHLPNVLGMLPMLLLKKKFAIYWHADIVQTNEFLRKLFFPIEKLVISKADKVIFATEGHIKGSLHNFKNARKMILPYTINNEKRANKTYAQKQDKKTDIINVIFIGRLVEYKGIKFLLDAFPEQGFRLDIIGSGELEDEVNIKIQSRKNIYLHKNINDEDLEGFFLKSDLLVLPSINKKEMFGIVQIEAFARGIPVISSKIENSGVPIVNSNKNTGFLVKPKCVSDLKNKLIDFKNNQHYFKKEIIRSEYDKKYSNITFKKNISDIINV